MKIILCTIFAALVMICGLSTTSTAQTAGNNPNIRAVLHQQQVRIADGIKDGSLTPAEAERLNKREAAIRRQAAKFRESGNTLTPQERRRLRAELMRTSRMIFRLRHNQDGVKL